MKYLLLAICAMVSTNSTQVDKLLKRTKSEMGIVVIHNPPNKKPHTLEKVQSNKGDIIKIDGKDDYIIDEQEAKYLNDLLTQYNKDKVPRLVSLPSKTGKPDMLIQVSRSGLADTNGYYLSEILKLEDIKIGLEGKPKPLQKTGDVIWLDGEDYVIDEMQASQLLRLLQKAKTVTYGLFYALPSKNSDKPAMIIEISVLGLRNTNGEYMKLFEEILLNNIQYAGSKPIKNGANYEFTRSFIFDTNTYNATFVIDEVQASILCDLYTSSMAGEKAEIAIESKPIQIGGRQAKVDVVFGTRERNKIYEKPIDGNTLQYLK